MHSGLEKQKVGILCRLRNARQQEGRKKEGHQGTCHPPRTRFEGRREREVDSRTRLLG